MKLIIGLGNPGEQYEKTKHNAGFLVLEKIRTELEFPFFQFNKKFNALVSEATKNGEKIILALPQTFMNLSGKSVRAIMDFYKINTENLIVVHDDLDIDLGKFKISLDSSSGGHNGVQNIIENIGTQTFKRIRIGIEGAEAKKERRASGKDFVMQNFSNEEIDKLNQLSIEIIKEI